MNWASPKSLLGLSSLMVFLLVAGLAIAAYLFLGREAEARAADQAFANLSELETRLRSEPREALIKTLLKTGNRANKTTVYALYGDLAQPSSAIVRPLPVQPTRSSSPIYEVNGEEVYGFWVPVGAGQWIFSGELLSPYYRNVYRTVAAIVLSGLLAALVLASAAFLAQRRLRNQLILITRTCTEIGSGALHLRVPESLTSTELSDIARQVNMMVGRLERRVQDLRTLSRTLSHDLRNYVVYARVQMKKVRPANGGEQQHLERASESLRLLDLVAVEVARLSMERANMSWQTEVHDLATIAASSVELFRDSCEDSGIKLNTDLQSAPAEVSPSMVLSVTNNLISNAIKYGCGGGVIEARTYVAENECLLVVEDHGPGIPEAFQDRIFQLEHRLARDEAQEGLGYGLAIAKLLTELSGGTIRVTSARDDVERPGARFTVAFPKARI